MRAGVRWAISMGFVVAATVASAEENPSSAFDAGTVAFAAEDYALALEQFAAALAAGIDGPAVHYNLAVCHYKLGDWAAARAEFELVAERYPQMRALARYNIGLVAQQEGRREEADELFRSVLAETDDATIRHLASQQLASQPAPAAPEAEPRRWLTLIDARLGHDDNVLLLAEEITLPRGESAESPFTEFWALITGPLSDADRRLRFDGSVYAVRYADAPTFDQTVARAAGAYEWRVGEWAAEVGPHLSLTTLDGDTFEKRLGVGVRLRRPIAAATWLGVRFVHDEIDEGAERFEAFQGSRDWLELRVDHDIAAGRVTLGYAYEVNDRRGANVSADRDRLSARYRHFFERGWLADVEASWRDSRYGDLAQPRDEDLTEYSLAVSRTLARGWQVGGELSFGDNASNFETFAYDRNRMALGFTKEF